MKRTICILICLVVVSTSGYAAGKWFNRPNPERMQTVYETIKNARIFSVGGTGISGVRSREETAFRELLAQPEPVARCQRLLAEGTPAGQMYALLGLRQLNQREFQAVLRRYKDAKAEVPTAAGYIVTNSNTAYLAQQIAWGAYR